MPSVFFLNLEWGTDQGDVRAILDCKLKSVKRKSRWLALLCPPHRLRGRLTILCGLALGPADDCGPRLYLCNYLQSDNYLRYTPSLQLLWATSVPRHSGSCYLFALQGRSLTPPPPCSRGTFKSLEVEYSINRADSTSFNS